MQRAAKDSGQAAAQTCLGTDGGPSGPDPQCLGGHSLWQTACPQQPGPDPRGSHNQAQEVDMERGAGGEVSRLTSPHQRLRPSVFTEDPKHLSHWLWVGQEDTRLQP